MSRKSREIGLEHRDRWPRLANFLASYLHEDWPVSDDSPEAAVDRAVAEYDLQNLKAVAKEWWSWNGSAYSSSHLLNSVGDGLGVNVRFGNYLEARHFMNSVYDKLVVRIRQTDPSWKPVGPKT